VTPQACHRVSSVCSVASGCHPSKICALGPNRIARGRCWAIEFSFDLIDPARQFGNIAARHDPSGRYAASAYYDRRHSYSCNLNAI
jgi:hypothetical protein